MTRLTSPPALILAATLCLGGCVTVPSEPVPVPVLTTCPAWPAAGPAVAAELGTLPVERYPATWGWIDRLSRLRDQLGACHRG